MTLVSMPIPLAALCRNHCDLMWILCFANGAGCEFWNLRLDQRRRSRGYYRIKHLHWLRSDSPSGEDHWISSWSRIATLQRVLKNQKAIFDDDTGLGDCFSVVHNTTTITKGRGRGVAFATGMYREISLIASALQGGYYTGKSSLRCTWHIN